MFLINLTPFLLNPNLSFLKQTQDAKSYKLSGYYAEIRDEKYRNIEDRYPFNC